MRFLDSTPHKPQNPLQTSSPQKYSITVLFFASFWARCWNHCLAALGLGTGAEQQFCCLNVQNSQAMLFMGRSMDWTLEDNMVDGLFFCATLTGRRGGHTSFVQAGAETSDTGAVAVKPDPRTSWEGHIRVGGCRCRGWKCGVLWCCPSIPHSIGDPPTAPHVSCRCQMNGWDVVRAVQTGASIWGPVHLHLMDRWALSETGVQAPWHGVLGTICWLHCDKAQQVGCLRELEGCPLL